MPQGTKTPPAFFFALGDASMPPRCVLDGHEYVLRKIFKHDFFAATGLYDPVGAASPAPGPAVVKIQRTQSLLGFPMEWLGRRVARREIDIFQTLQGVAGIPRFLGVVGPTGFAHAFVPGADLTSDQRPGQTFFKELADLLRDIHDRHIAYVDTNKRENILLGDDGRPHLIDFQISFICRRGASDNVLRRWVLRKLQAEDWYHYYKHKTRLAPECCLPEDFDRAAHRSGCIRLHRFFARPVIRVRRRFLARYNTSHPNRQADA